MEIFDRFLKYSDKENLLPTSKRLLSFAFVVLISSKIFTHFYFNYQLNVWNDYNAHFNFISEGRFIVPLSIFILIWSSTHFIGITLLSILDYSITFKLKSKIINISLFKNEYILQAKAINKLLDKTAGLNPKKEWFITIYEILKKSISKENYAKLITDLEKRRFLYESDFILILRSLVGIIILASSSIIIGGFLLTLILLFQLILLISTIIKIQFSELFPIAIHKVTSEMELYIKNNSYEIPSIDSK